MYIMLLAYSPGLTTVTLTGDEWIRYNLYEDVDVERSHMAGIRVALDFRVRINKHRKFEMFYPFYPIFSHTLHFKAR